MRIIVLRKSDPNAVPLVFADAEMAAAHVNKQTKKGRADFRMMTEREWVLMTLQPWKKVAVRPSSLDDDDSNII